MMDFIRRMKQNIVADAIVCLVIGAVMLFWPGFSAELLCTVIAWMVILVGAFMVIDFFAKREEGFYSGMILGIGGIITVFGIILLTHVNSFILFIPKIFGIVILVSGVMNLAQVIALGTRKDRYWYVPLIFALITVLIGVVFLTRSGIVTRTFIRIMGVCLIYNGISDLWTIMRVSKYLKEEMQEKNAVDTTYRE